MNIVIDQTKLRPGDIVFQMGQNFTSRAFAWFMGSRWSHCFMIAGMSDVGTSIVESSVHGVALAPLSKYLNPVETQYFEVWSSKSLDQIQRLALINRLSPIMGCPYGYLQLISFALKCLFQKIGISIPNFIRQGFICDQIIFLAYKYTQIPGLAGVDPKSMQTEELYQIVSKSSEFDLVISAKV